jgi:hypothetical protein
MGEPHTAAGKAAVEQAKALCNECPAFDACAEYGLREPEGIWFGTTPKERRKLTRTPRRPLSPKRCANPNCPRPEGMFRPERSRQEACSLHCARVAKGRSPWRWKATG